MNTTIEEGKELIRGAFERLSDEVSHMLEHHKVLPAEISVPFNKDGKWIRVRLNITEVKSEDPEGIKNGK